MAKVFIEETTLTAIGDAIRGKEGTTALVPVNDMATRITSLQTGSNPVIKSLEITSNGTYTATDCDGYSPITVNVPQDGAPTDEELTFTGNCDYLFYNQWYWVMDKYKDRVKFIDVTQGRNMFYEYPYDEIPCDINVKNLTILEGAFSYAKLKKAPKIRGNIKWSTSTTLNNLFFECKNLADLEDVFTPEMLDGFSTVKVTSAYSCSKPSGLPKYSLRRIPSWWYKFKLNPESTVYPASSYTIYVSLVLNFKNLDEMVNIPVWKCSGALTSNYFGSGGECYRLKNFTFETNPDGTPIEVNWKSQTIDLSNFIGYYYTSSSEASFSVSQRQVFVKLNCYNSGITEDKLIYNDETYQRLKDDPDSFAVDCGTSTGSGYYSRYNHDSAVATINSLPDTSAYLATAGGTNTIKFKGSQGGKTDGGAINTLTEAEIAVAAAKGWTVTLV